MIGNKKTRRGEQSEPEVLCPLTRVVFTWLEMGALTSRQNIGVEEVDIPSNSVYRYPPKSGKSPNNRSDREGGSVSKRGADVSIRSISPGLQRLGTCGETGGLMSFITVAAAASLCQNRTETWPPYLHEKRWDLLRGLALLAGRSSADYDISL